MKKIVNITILILFSFNSSCAFFAGKLMITEPSEKTEIIQRDLIKTELITSPEIKGNILTIKFATKESFQLKEEKILLNKKKINWVIFCVGVALDFLSIMIPGIIFIISNNGMQEKNSEKNLVLTQATFFTGSLIVGFINLNPEVINTIEMSKEETEETTLKNSKVILKTKDKIFTGSTDNNGLISFPDFKNDEISKEIEVTVYTLDNKEIKQKGLFYPK